MKADVLEEKKKAEMVICIQKTAGIKKSRWSRTV